MVVRLTIGDGGDGAAFSKAFGLMADAVEDLSPIWEEVVKPWAERHFRKQFETEGAYGGQKWVGYDNEPRYARAKMSMVGHNDLLRWHKGGMEMLAPSLMNLDDPFAIFEVGPSKVRIGSNVPHAADIERNTKGPWWSGSEPSPARIIMTATDPQKKELILRVHRAIHRRLGEQGVEIGDARFNL